MNSTHRQQILAYAVNQQFQAHARERRPMTGPATNTFTVTIADAHAHSVAQAGIAASSKNEAALNALQAIQGSEGSELSSLLTADTWTITITQP